MGTGTLPSLEVDCKGCHAQSRTEGGVRLPFVGQETVR